MMKEVLDTKQLSIGYHESTGTKVVRENLNLHLRNGELTCLLGANGAGKSTLLRTLNGYIPALKGSIVLDGKELSAYSEKELAKKISIVLTERIDDAFITVFELVSLGRSPYTGYFGTLTAEDKEVIERSLEQVHIAHLMHRKYSELSDGEKQKCMIAKALAQETPIILLDEPMAFLDLPSKIETLQLLRNLARKENKAILLSTHELEQALQHADKFWLLDRQRSIINGTPEDLVLNGAFAEVFDSNNIKFDSTDGTFKMKDSPKGQGLRFAPAVLENRWLLQALLKNGLWNDQQSDFEVRIDDGRYTLLKEEEILLTAVSIENFIRSLKAQFK